MKKVLLLACCFCVMNSFAQTKTKTVRYIDNDVYYTPAFEKKTEKTHTVQNNLQILLEKQNTAYKVGVGTLCASVVFGGVGGVLLSVAAKDDFNTTTSTAGYVLLGVSGASVLASGVSFMCALGYQIKINDAISVELNAGKIALNF